MEEFELYNEYSRDDLLKFVGSKQTQTGIIWGEKEPGCLIVTSGGRHSKRAGYGDTRNEDGSWYYFGQGERGNQDPDKFSNSLLADPQRTILLFTTREPTWIEVKRQGSYSKKYKFEGAFGTTGWEYYVPRSGPRAGDELLRFELVPVNLAGGMEIGPVEEYGEPRMDLHEIRKNLYAEAESQVRTKKISTVEYRLRSSKIRMYARLRARGICEYCSNPAPFYTPTGEPFLEVHHIHRLADDGPDVPYNVAALCPNCHRESHQGSKSLSFREKVAGIIRLKEDTIGNQAP